MSKLTINDIGNRVAKAKELTPITQAMLANQGLMGITGVKQVINIRGHQMPSMNYTHYVRFARHPQGVLEWLLKCNFLPLFFTGNSTQAEECLNAQYYLDNLQDDIEGVHDRYPITNHDLDAYKALIPVSKITPHMILDFRGFGGICDGAHDVFAAWMAEVIQYVRKHQDALMTYGDKWNIDKNHNPMITVLADYETSGGNRIISMGNKMQLVHSQNVVDDFEHRGWGFGTVCETWVRVYTKQEN